MEQVRNFLLGEGPAILKSPIQNVFIQNDFHFWNIQIEKRDGRWKISGLFDFEFALRGDARLDLAWTGHAHEAYLPIFNDRFSFSAGYGGDLDPLPAEVKKLYTVYREVLAVHFFIERKKMEQFPRHLNTLEGLFLKN